MKKGVILIISIIFAIFYVVYASGGPAISWVGGTPDNAEIIYTENISLNITLTEDTNLSTFFDWNNSLVSYWNFESYNSSGIFDNSSHDNFLSFYGSLSSSTLVNSTYGSGMYFDGTNDKLQLDWNSSFDKPIDGLTISFWLNQSVMPDWNYDFLLARAYNTSWVDPYFEYGIVSKNILSNTTHFELSSRIDGTVHGDSDPISYDVWHHISMVWNGSSQDLIYYVDGVAAGTDNQGISSIAYQLNAPFLVGLNLDNGEDFKGSLDEIMIFSRALSIEEINAAYFNTALRLDKDFNNLSDGNYSFAAYAMNSGGNLTISYRNFSKGVVYPLNSTPTISSIDGTNSNTSDLNCSATITHEIGNPLNATVGWYRDDVLNLTLFYNNDYSNGTSFSSILNATPVEFNLDPPGIDAQDFSIYYEDGWYHIYYIKNNEGETWTTQGNNSQFFGYEKSQDLSHWSLIDNVLRVDNTSDWNNQHVWAPHVFKNGSTYYMYYTGIDNQTGGAHTERVGLATSSNLQDWTRSDTNNCNGTTGNGCVWDCNTTWSGWDAGFAWDGQCRDPYVLDDVASTGYYYMVYTANTLQYVQIVGLAKSTDLINWEDVGPINRTSSGKQSYQLTLKNHFNIFNC